MRLVPIQMFSRNVVIIPEGFILRTAHAVLSLAHQFVVFVVVEAILVMPVGTHVSQIGDGHLPLSAHIISHAPHNLTRPRNEI